MSFRFFSVRHIRAIAFSSTALVFAPLASADTGKAGGFPSKDEVTSATSNDPQYATVPKSPAQVELEIRRVAQKIDDLERKVMLAERRKADLAEQFTDLQQSVRTAAPLSSALKPLLNDISAADCKSEMPAPKVLELRRLIEVMNELSEPDGFSRRTIRPPSATPGPRQCSELKAFALEWESLPREAEKLTRDLEKEVRRVGRQQAQDADDTRQLAEQKQWLDRLRASAEESGRIDVIEKLPMLIVFLGIFSLSIMVMVRRFIPDIQREWVQSGQVIQFMTVTVIVIAVLSLGLAEKLSKENLGTLLGTIGGYVLAQGIGRSASRKDPSDKLGSARLPSLPHAPANPTPLVAPMALPNAE
jgi:hypothetical protein